jgi:hypothetical protein
MDTKLARVGCVLTLTLEVIGRALVCVTGTKNSGCSESRRFRGQRIAT